MLAGFAIEGFVLSAVLVHMVPLLGAVGIGTAAVFVAGLFGPAQVASRFVNMLFGRGVRQTWLAVSATGSLAAGLAVLLVTAPHAAGAAVFAFIGCNGVLPGAWLSSFCWGENLAADRLALVLAGCEVKRVETDRDRSGDES